MSSFHSVCFFIADEAVIFIHACLNKDDGCIAIPLKKIFGKLQNLAVNATRRKKNVIF